MFDFRLVEEAGPLFSRHDQKLKTNTFRGEKKDKGPVFFFKVFGTDDFAPFPLATSTSTLVFLAFTNMLRIGSNRPIAPTNLSWSED